MESVLITGCSGGLGLEAALYLAERGFNVFATLRDMGKRQYLLDCAAQRGVSLEVLRLDVVDPDSIDSAVNHVLERAGGIYGLVNNAGTGLRGCLEDLSEAEIRQVFDVNVFGTIAVTQRVLPHMRVAGRGRIVTMSSVGARIASFGLSGYCASRFALEGFAEALALEVAPFGIQSILVEPGIIKTPYWTTANRGTAKNAEDPTSAYASMFRRHEALADRIADRSRTKPVHVAKVVHRALTVRHPQLRYVVGQPAGLLISLRRHLPGDLFERVYFPLVLRLLGHEGWLYRLLMAQPPAALAASAASQKNS
jgi:NAD(P)-dependent dehydrogenase (short-subunit alcohol dehydrogenase family)